MAAYTTTGNSKYSYFLFPCESNNLFNTSNYKILILFKEFLKLRCIYLDYMTITMCHNHDRTTKVKVILLKHLFQQYFIYRVYCECHFYRWRKPIHGENHDRTVVRFTFTKIDQRPTSKVK